MYSVLKRLLTWCRLSLDDLMGLLSSLRSPLKSGQDKAAILASLDRSRRDLVTTLKMEAENVMFAPWRALVRDALAFAQLDDGGDAGVLNAENEEFASSRLGASPFESESATRSRLGTPSDETGLSPLPSHGEGFYSFFDKESGQLVTRAFPGSKEPSPLPVEPVSAFMPADEPDVDLAPEQHAEDDALVALASQPVEALDEVDDELLLPPLPQYSAAAAGRAHGFNILAAAGLLVAGLAGAVGLSFLRGGSLAAPRFGGTAKAAPRVSKALPACGRMAPPLSEDAWWDDLEVRWKPSAVLGRG